ncbi:hypothetical protein F4678DRAFT_256395 [Xylaria arbuscula]|nr:hypothetical protein F4678DRAFT_256395 [Xylaria arbuscula]
MEKAHRVQGTKRRYSGEQSRRAFPRDDGTTALDDGSADDVHTGYSLVSKPSENNRPGATSGLADRGEDYFTDLYSTEPDFRRLGLEYPEFGAMLKDGAHLDFTDPAAVMQLTRTLLKEDFGLQIRLPPDRLCPPVPNRHNYILWLKELMDSTSASYSQQYEPERKVTGLDIGTGASLIYPLLGCAERPNWHFIATDIDTESLASARENARLNNLESRIRVVARAASDRLIPDLDTTKTIDFVMTNPPFYASDTEFLELAAQKSQPPHSACTGAPVEMVCGGGEVGFVERIMNESLILRDRVKWYTAMLGKQSSLDILVETLKKHKISNFAVTAFIQGSKTRRWALGWSFLTRRPSTSISRGCGSSVARKMLPPVTGITIYGPSAHVLTDRTSFLKKALCDAIGSLDLRRWAWDDQRLRGVGFADGNVWSRAYRRRRASESAAMIREKHAISPSDVTDCAFGFSVSIQAETLDNSRDASPAVTLCWLQGDDESLFESFSGVIRRCLRAEASATEAWGS